MFILATLPLIDPFSTPSQKYALYEMLYSTPLAAWAQAPENQERFYSDLIATRAAEQMAAGIFAWLDVQGSLAEPYGGKLLAHLGYSGLNLKAVRRLLNEHP